VALAAALGALALAGCGGGGSDPSPPPAPAPPAPAPAPAPPPAATPTRPAEAAGTDLCAALGAGIGVTTVPLSGPDAPALARAGLRELAAMRESLAAGPVPAGGEAAARALAADAREGEALLTRALDALAAGNRDAVAGIERDLPSLGARMGGRLGSLGCSP
jgi:hypothetical protein